MLFFCTWLAATSVAGAWMLALDATPSGDMPDAKVVQEARTALYVLGSDCGLSTAVAEQLAQHAPRSDLNERVCFLTDAPEAARRLAGAGFVFERINRAALPGMRAGPWLVLFDSAGRRTFSGPFPKDWNQAEPGLGLHRFLARLTRARI